MKKLTHKDFMQFQNNFDPDIELLSQYEKSSTKIKCRCKLCNREWMANPQDIKKGKGCIVCKQKKNGKKLRKDHNSFVHEMSIVNSNIKIVGRYRDSHTLIECKCLIHREIYKSSPTHLLRGKTGCSKCRSEKIGNKLRKSHDQFVSELQSISSTINVLGEYNGASKRILVQCNVCNNKWEPVASSLLSGFGCPYCNRSTYEIEIDKLLKQYNISFISQYTFDELRGKKNVRLSYDFYLPDYKLLIEFQGQFHDNSLLSLQSKNELKRRKELDCIKKDYAIQHGFNYCEIWYYEFDRVEEIILNIIDNLKNPVTTTVA